MKYLVKFAVVATASFTSFYATAGSLRYPVVLAHGLLAGDGKVSMKNIAKELQDNGIEVYMTEVLAAGSIADRAQDLAENVDDILAVSGAAKVNIIAHSMGGLDARYLISKLGYAQKVASLTTVSTPHRGAVFADRVIAELNTGKRSGLLRLMEVLATFYNDQTTRDNVDLRRAIFDMTTAQMNKFNQNIKNDARVVYLSFASEGQRRQMHRVLRPIHDYITDLAGPNDGLVEVYSAAWGEFLGKPQCDHFSIGGMGRPRFTKYCNYEDFYLDVVGELASRGL